MKARVKITRVFGPEVASAGGL